ncbi:type I restriction enzyme HsdR N-terminal domain-containing protein [Methylobacillus flagellatus]|uniref:type I restriction enzyme HsdR N-terminal domain-containing protein n=1 Tax=Methylobacillus flagellatus TaxID=405 RepID=UPI0010F636A0|nr:type I restriction enzyme HsdR N-terminal domain-containing protein [Methylobacillus flagellatus]
MAISKKVVDRITVQLKRYIPILIEAKNRDINESDTVAIISDMLADLLGYKKYIEITSEQAIRGTFVDLMVRIGEEERFLVEAKAIGITLKDQHVKQAMEYGAHKGIEWVILTNGVIWRVYKIHFSQPIDQTLVFELDLLQPGVRSSQHVECLSILSREAFSQNAMTAFYQQKQITGKYSIAAILLTVPILAVLKKELRKIEPKLKLDDETLKSCLEADIIKRELIDSDEGKQASEFLKKLSKAAARAKVKKATVSASNNTLAPI